MATALAAHYQEPLVPEFAREYLEGIGRPYVEDDLIQIALGQSFSEDKGKAKANRMYFCDTDLLTLRIWSKVKYGQFDKRINPLWFDALPQLYFVCAPDLPWEPDPQRENPEDREMLFDIYIAEIERAKVNYAVIRGEDRVGTAVGLLDGFLEKVASR